MTTRVPRDQSCAEAVSVAGCLLKKSVLLCLLKMVACVDVQFNYMAIY